MRAASKMAIAASSNRWAAIRANRLAANHMVVGEVCDLPPIWIKRDKVLDSEADELQTIYLSSGTRRQHRTRKTRDRWRCKVWMRTWRPY
jgi:hypothetical protein